MCWWSSVFEDALPSVTDVVPVLPWRRTTDGPEAAAAPPRGHEVAARHNRPATYGRDTEW